MSPRRRPGKRLLKWLLPIVLIPALVLVIVVGIIVYRVTHPAQRSYLVTPDNFAQLSNRKATNETWYNHDGTQARGWLLRGIEGAPAVILLHRYDTDRSWLLNLGVKLNEATNYTVLLPDLRGHGLDPPSNWTSFGTREAEDVMAALEFLRALQTPQGQALAGKIAGLYGVEMGGYAALRAAARDANVRALALDSVPAAPDDLLHMAFRQRTGLDNSLLKWLVRGGTHFYFFGNYDNRSSCENAAALNERRILLLAGDDAAALRETTNALGACIPQGNSLEIKNTLPRTGFNLPFATGEQSEAYDRLVIDFFNKALRL
ncbi:MAG TPA: alpha/beta fold hydrolase [Pyrinomonadaceae bacterium]|jgi:pimeloyl-ACP methyl ester carboxylesterase